MQPLASSQSSSRSFIFLLTLLSIVAHCLIDMSDISVYFSYDGGEGKYKDVFTFLFTSLSSWNVHGSKPSPTMQWFFSRRGEGCAVGSGTNKSRLLR